jgi:glyoxylase I family protein
MASDSDRGTEGTGGSAPRASRAKGTNATIGGGGFHHVAVRVPDFDAAMRFYKDVLGFTERVAWGEGEKRAVMLDVGDGNYLEVFAGGTAAAPKDGPILHIALRSDDVDGACERARAAGAEVTVEPKDVTIPSRPQPLPARIAFFRGPAGEVFELFSNQLT